MLKKIYCPCIRVDAPFRGVTCNRYLGEVDGHYQFKCYRCKGVVEGDTKEGWIKIIRKPER